MQRPPVYDYTITKPPGVNVHRLRSEILDWSQRTLADKCHPPLDHTTIRRVEQNEGFTQDTLERVANAFTRALGYPITVADLFLPPELTDWPLLSARARERIAESVQDAAAAGRYRSHKTG